MRMNDSWKNSVENHVQSRIVGLHEVGGGDFAQAFKASLSNGGSLFVKTHQNPPAHFFTTEAAGLKWLRKGGHVNVPDVLCASDSPPFLAMQWIELGSGDVQTERTFGRELAQLHRAEFSVFGRPDNRTTGSLAVPNNPSATWVDFYAGQRLMPLAKLANDKHALSAKAVSMIETLAGRLADFGANEEPASLLHGDLWAGNRVVDVHGKSWLIDPAAHGGHREFDLAMMRLFGGYGEDCFAAYQESFPLQAGWQNRVQLHQLAPLIVHAIKFGGSYRSATQSALASYV